MKRRSLRTVPLHSSLTRPILLGGAERDLVIIEVSLIAALLFVLAACDQSTDPSSIVLGAGDLPPSAGYDMASGTWQSVGFDAGDRWHDYPGRVTLSIEHGLPRAPRVVLVYISFEPDGSGATLASGDLAQVDGVDATTVVVHNRTDADLFCRVVLE